MSSASLPAARLVKQVPLPEHHPSGMEESAWIEVIQRMDEIYADLVRYQVDLEQKNAALEDAHRFIESVLSAMSDILVVCDTRGHIQRVNRALEQLTGKTSDELHGLPLTALFLPKHKAAVEGLAEHIRSEPFSDCELDLLDRAGQPAPMALNATARYDHNNRLCGMVLTGRPLGELRSAYSALQKTHDELKAAQQQLLQSEKMASLGRLVAGVAHELNNPISYIFGNMHALKRYEERFQRYLSALHGQADAAECARLRETLKIDRMLDDLGPLITGSLEGAERISDIVQNLGRFANPKAGRAEHIDLVKLIDTALHWIVRACRQKPVIQLALPDTLPVYANEGHVHQILINLIQNAIDALYEQPPRPGQDEPCLMLAAGEENNKILSCQRGQYPADSQGKELPPLPLGSPIGKVPAPRGGVLENHVWITVADNGPGIQPDDLLRLFDPFFTTKPVGKGTGLGLYVSYGLATEKCQGELSAANRPGGGALFTLRLPKTLPDASP